MGLVDALGLALVLAVGDGEPLGLALDDADGDGVELLFAAGLVVEAAGGV